MIFNEKINDSHPTNIIPNHIYPINLINKDILPFWNKKLSLQK